MDYNGTGNDGDAPARLLHLAHHLRDARDAALDAPLRRDVVAHERESKPVALPEFRRDANAVVSTDDRLTRLDVAQLSTLRLRRGHDDHRVHPLFFDFDPLALQADMRPVIE